MAWFSGGTRRSNVSSDRLEWLVPLFGVMWPGTEAPHAVLFGIRPCGSQPVRDELRAPADPLLLHPGRLRPEPEPGRRSMHPAAPSRTLSGLFRALLLRPNHPQMSSVWVRRLPWEPEQFQTARAVRRFLSTPAGWVHGLIQSVFKVIKLLSLPEVKLFLCNLNMSWITSFLGQYIANLA